MIEPLRLSFDVVCSIEHAFAVWTSRIGGQDWRDRNRAGWDTWLPHYMAAVEGAN